MLTVNRLSKRYGAQTILDGVTFTINQSDRVGLVGSNGCGKTTLLRIIAGQEDPTSGHVHLDPNTAIGYLPQQPPARAGMTLKDEVSMGIPGYTPSRRQVERLTTRMARAEGQQLDELIRQYSRALNSFESLGGYVVEHRIGEILAGLGLGSLPLDTQVDILSGGQQARVGLARLLISEPDLIMLDEPTNHLDIQALEWLESFLQSYRGAALIVSHDRAFLDHTVSRILELDEDTHRITAYPGNYSNYAAARERHTQKQWALWKDQRAEIRRITDDIQRTKEQAQKTERATKSDHARRLAKKVAKKAKSRERRLRRYRKADDQVAKPTPKWRMKLDFGDLTRSGQIVLTLKNLGHRFTNDWLFRKVNLKIEHGQRVVLLGPNGSGKTTLLRIILNELAPLEGTASLGANVRVGYMPQKQHIPDTQETPLTIIRHTAALSETEARNFLHHFLFAGDEVFVPLTNLSTGERARLRLAQLVVAGANFLVLDEPINHLDIPSRERFTLALQAYPGTVLAVVHDRVFIEQYATREWSLESGVIHETQHSLL